jgi:hypothetical protein
MRQKKKRGLRKGEGYTVSSTEMFVASTGAPRWTDDDDGGLERERATSELGFGKTKVKTEEKSTYNRGEAQRSFEAPLQRRLSTVTEELGAGDKRSWSVSGRGKRGARHGVL